MAHPFATQPDRREKSDFYHGLLDARAAYDSMLKQSPNSPWTPRALFYSGCISQTAGKAPADAIRYWERLLKKHPNSPLCEEGLYYIGVVLEWGKDWAGAKKAYERFLKKFPDSSYVRAVEEYHLPRVAKGLRGEKVPW